MRRTLLAASVAMALTGLVTGAQQLTTNEQLIIDFFNFTGSREARAARFMTADYRQHNPRFLRMDEFTGAAGSQAWVRAFDEAAKRGVQLVALNGIRLRDPIIVMHDGDMAMAVYRGTRPDPARPGSSYEIFAFESFRFRDGRFSEHWDQVRLAPGWLTPAPAQGARRGAPPAAAAPAPSPPPIPKPDAGCTATPAELDANRTRIVSLLSGAPAAVTAALAPGFVEHSPRGLAQGPIPEPDAVSARAVDHVLAECDYVSVVWKQVVRDPDAPSRTWEAFTFDTVRLADGRIAEHWDAAASR